MNTWITYGFDLVILGMLIAIIRILQDIAAMERFNYHGAEKR